MGVLLALTAACGWGVGAVLTRLGLTGVRISTGTLISLVASLAVVFTAAVFFNREGFEHLSWPVAVWFAMTGVVGYPLGRRLNFQAVHYLGASRATPIISSSPLFAIAIATMFTGETLLLPQLLGAVMVVAGLALVMTDGK